MKCCEYAPWPFAVNYETVMFYSTGPRAHCYKTSYARNLEKFVVSLSVSVGTLQPNLMFVGKKLVSKNTLAYYEHSYIMSVKSFIGCKGLPGTNTLSDWAH
jgi:hypothetical protein